MSEDQMSFAEGFPVRTSPSPASKRALMGTAAAYGQSSPVSLASYDPATQSWRTCQACFLTGWAEFSETWPRSGMMRSGTAYQLQPLVRLTGGTASGLWATPVAQPANGTPEQFLERKRQSVRRGNKMDICVSDLAMQVKMWPTPRANDAEKRGAIADDPRNGLPAAAKHWPTPRASDTKNLRNLGPTIQKRQEQGRLSVAEAVKLWPTPTARDFRTGDKPESKRARMKQSGEWHSPNLNDVASPGGQLNPTWVEWLMGFPLGWTALEPSETPSSRKSSK